MTIPCALMVLVVAILVTTITSLYDLAVWLFIWHTINHMCLDTNNNHVQLIETAKFKSLVDTPSTSSKTKHKSPPSIRQYKYNTIQYNTKYFILESP